MSRYHLIPQLSPDLDDGEFKSNRRRPRSRSFSYVFAVLRKTRRVCRPVHIIIAIVLLLFLQVTFNSSYTSPPIFTASPDETVFIAANIIDSSLIEGPWGRSLLELVDLIGKDRVHVSIYGGSSAALQPLQARLPCENTIVSEEDEPIDLDSIQHTKLNTGESRIRRIAYLAEVRNRALRPLDALTRQFDRVLFLNDVFFDAHDAVRLLWGTNVNQEGKADYVAACGADFVAPWKYYDTFATRDYEGYSLGVPIFPWFSNEGHAQSRMDVLNQRSAVRVKSCWGGIVAFDGRYFQRDLASSNIAAPRDGRSQDSSRQNTAAETEESNMVEPVTLPIRFRSSSEPYREASECCLIHADLIAASSPPPDPGFTLKQPRWGEGIYMNPYVRVSYDATTHSQLWIMKRFERLAILPQRLINYFANMPHFNARRTEVEGEVYTDRQWVPRNSDRAAGADAQAQADQESEHGAEHPWQRALGGGQRGRVDRRNTSVGAPGKEFWRTEGHYVDYRRTAERGGYCGTRALQVLKQGSWDHGNWETLEEQVPPLESEF
jgi:hypothetical protein